MYSLISVKIKTMKFITCCRKCGKMKNGLIILNCMEYKSITYAYIFCNNLNFYFVFIRSTKLPSVPIKQTDFRANFLNILKEFMALNFLQQGGLFCKNSPVVCDSVDLKYLFLFIYRR